MTQETEELWCKVGSHYWDRPRGKGRKPVSCPDHRGGESQGMTQNGRQPRSSKPKPGTCQYAIILADGKAELEDGSTVPLANPGFGEGDQGMAEYLNGVWTFTLFEAAAKPEPPKPAKKRTQTRSKGKGKDAVPTEHPVPREPAQSPTERSSRIVVLEPEIEEDEDKDEEGKPKVTKPSRITLQEIIDTYHPDKETLAKLEYIDRILKEKRSRKDHEYTLDTQRMILSRLRSRHAR